ncbi:MAG: asparagine synthetase B, partial [Gemmatimonadales bacterium]|nr:asparagine synthetase B [Gemmatimonadales bacterium]
MCGLTGFFTAADRTRDTMTAAVERMTATIVHRGPDDAGTFVEENAGVALGFRRLAIVDLSPLGHQPMDSASGRFTMAFNGEFYNHADLRAQLAAAGATFRGTS